MARRSRLIAATAVALIGFRFCDVRAEEISDVRAAILVGCASMLEQPSYDALQGMECTRLLGTVTPDEQRQIRSRLNGCKKLVAEHRFPENGSIGACLRKAHDEGW